MSAPVAEDRDGTVMDADGTVVDADSTDMCYNLHIVLTKHVKRSVEWEEHIERLGIRGGVHRRFRLTLVSAYMENLRRRVDPKTGLVRPLTAHMARELGVSRSTVSRQLRGLRQCGAFETVDVRIGPNQLTTYYRLKG